jgi:hypothetical protein
MCVGFGLFSWTQAHVSCDQDGKSKLYSLPRLVVCELIKLPKESQNVLNNGAVG